MGRPCDDCVHHPVTGISDEGCLGGSDMEETCSFNNYSHYSPKAMSKSRNKLDTLFMLGEMTETK